MTLTRRRCCERAFDGAVSFPFKKSGHNTSIHLLPHLYLFSIDQTEPIDLRPHKIGEGDGLSLSLHTHSYGNHGRSLFPFLRRYVPWYREEPVSKKTKTGNEGARAHAIQGILLEETICFPATGKILPNPSNGAAPVGPHQMERKKTYLHN